MYIPRRRKARLKMGLMIAISSLSIGALAASTMAWYSVNTSITVNSSTVSIRTALQYHFYAYNGNGFDVSGNDYTAWKSGSGYNTPALSLTAVVDDVPTNYTEVNELAQYDNHKSDYLTALTKVSGLWPGYKMSFAVRIDGLQSGDQPSLTLNPALMNPGLADSEARLTRSNGNGGSAYVYREIGDANTPVYITMANAIKLSAGSGASLENAVGHATSGSPTDPVSTYTETSYRNYDANGRITTVLSSTANPISLGQSASGGNNTHSWWYFFTVEFSNHSTTYYSLSSTEVIRENETIVGYIEHYTQSESGNSSCYEGLPFALGTMDLK